MKIYFGIIKLTIEWMIYLAGVTRQRFTLRHYVNEIWSDYYLRSDRSQLIQQIFDGQMTYLDVGAMGGPLPVVKKYERWFKQIMIEPIPEEAARLREMGYPVIEQILFSPPPRKMTFYKNAMHGSLYTSRGPYLDFLNPDPDMMTMFDTIEEVPVETTTISQVLSEEGVGELDFLKIDTEGAELDILMGLGSYRPLIIVAELYWLPVYRGTPNIYEVCQYLLKLGYIPFNLTGIHHRSLTSVWGDGFFMPSWIEPAGRELILRREEQYIALMLMFAQYDTLKFVSKKLGLKNRRFIETIPYY